MTGRPWRPAPLISNLRAELDVGWPSRSTASDGIIGDQRHQSRHSDHNPNEYGYVRAIDITADARHGPPMDALAAFLRDVGASGSQRLALGGYVIWNRRIVSEQSEWLWMPYTGEDPHVSHLHLSVSRLPAFYKISRAWNVVDAVRARTQR